VRSAECGVRSKKQGKINCGSQILRKEGEKFVGNADLRSVQSSE